MPVVTFGDALVLLGFAVVVYGLAMVSVPLAVMFAGLVLAVAGALLSLASWSTRRAAPTKARLRAATMHGQAERGGDGDQAVAA